MRSENKKYTKKAEVENHVQNCSSRYAWWR